MSGEVVDVDNLDEYDRARIIDSIDVIIRWARAAHPLCHHVCPVCDALATFGGYE